MDEEFNSATGTKRVSQDSARLNPEEVHTEKLCAAKKARAGQLSAVTRVRRSIEALINNTDNAATVREHLFQYDEMWSRYIDTHDSLMTMVKADSEDQTRALHQHNQLTQERVSFREEVTSYLQTATTHFNQQVMQDLGSRNSPTRSGSRRAASTTSHGSLCSSTTRLRKAEALRAQLALSLAEQEKQRLIEAEIRILELEKRSREVARQRQTEEEELDRTRRFETLKLQAEGDLAEARAKVAFTELEAKLAQAEEEELDDGAFLTQVSDPLANSKDSKQNLGAQTRVASPVYHMDEKGVAPTLPFTRGPISTIPVAPLVLRTV